IDEGYFSLSFSHSEYRAFLTAVADAAGLGGAFREWGRAVSEWCERGPLRAPSPGPPLGLTADPVALLLWNDRDGLTSEECRRVGPRLRELAPALSGTSTDSPGCQKALWLADGLEMAGARGLQFAICP